MSNFPVGSKIIVTNADEGETYKNGDIYTVDSPEGPGVNVTVGGITRYIASYEFEAYSERKFKVGDKVVVTVSNEEWEYKAGDEGTVTYIATYEPKICVSGLDYVHTWNLKLAPAKAEPTPTSHIKVLATRHPREYEVGDILEVHAEQRHLPEEGEIRVTNKHGYTSAVFKGQWEYVAAPIAAPEPLAEWEKELLNVTPRTIAFADITKGDTIRAEYTQNGIKHTREGVAHEGYTGWSQAWATKEGDYVAHDSWKGATYTLLERPEPPKPNPFAEAKVGSIATYGEEGIKYLKTGDGAWSPISRKGTLSGYRNSDKSMTNCGDLIQVTHNA